MYRYAKVIALAATVAWLLFTFAAFKGFHFWYEGFVFFFWLSLAALNYRHHTTLWLAKNARYIFWRLYIILLIIGFIGDFVIGQQMAHLWSYPYFTSASDWIRLYLLIYPFGGLSILELTFLLGQMFGERFTYLPKVHSAIGRPVNLIDHIVDIALLVVLLCVPVLHYVGFALPLANTVVYFFLGWAVLTTLNLGIHLRHGWHWVAIFAATLCMSVLLHEVPNTAVFEWRYHSSPILNMAVLSIPLWVIVGWYIMVLIMLRVWLRFVLMERKFPVH